MARGERNGLIKFEICPRNSCPTKIYSRDVERKFSRVSSCKGNRSLSNRAFARGNVLHFYYRFEMKGVCCYSLGESEFSRLINQFTKFTERELLTYFLSSFLPFFLSMRLDVFMPMTYVEAEFQIFNRRTRLKHYSSAETCRCTSLFSMRTSHASIQFH